MSRIRCCTAYCSSYSGILGSCLTVVITAAREDDSGVVLKFGVRVESLRSVGS